MARPAWSTVTSAPREAVMEPTTDGNDFLGSSCQGANASTFAARSGSEAAQATVPGREPARIGPVIDGTAQEQ